MGVIVLSTLLVVQFTTIQCVWEKTLLDLWIGARYGMYIAALNDDYPENTSNDETENDILSDTDCESDISLESGTHDSIQTDWETDSDEDEE